MDDFKLLFNINKRSMKNYIIKGLFIITITGWSLSQGESGSKNKLTDIVLLNIEALSENEGPLSSGYAIRESKIVIDGYGQVGFQTVCTGDGDLIC